MPPPRSDPPEAAPGRKRERRIFRISKRVGPEILTVDLLLLPPYLQSVWDDREVYDVDGVALSVVSRQGLIEMKRIAGRPQDLSDVENLECLDGEGDAT